MADIKPAPQCGVRSPRLYLLGLLILLLTVHVAAPRVLAADLADLWAERIKCVVAVEFYVESETERRPSTSYGTVIDDQKTIILPSVAINPRATPSQLKEFKIYLPGSANGVAGVYLGQDALTGWHFVRPTEPLTGEVVPITKFVAPHATEPRLAEEVWGIGLRNKDEDFTPYLLSSRIALIESLPQRTAIAQQEVAGPGLPAFNRAGEFVGLAASSFGQNYIQFSRDEHGGQPVIMLNVEESGAMILANEVLPYLSRVPQNVFGRPLAWLGAYGFEPVAPDVAKFLKLETQSALVMSEVIDGSPAEAGGLKDRDILVGIDGKPLPRMKPDNVVVGYVAREIQRRLPGDRIVFTVLRGNEKKDATITLAEQPRLVTEAERKFFDRLGFTAREFVYEDAVARHVSPKEVSGVIAHFLKPNGPAAAAGLQTDDWIKEVDATEVKTFAAAADLLAKIDADAKRTEVVLLVNRGGETAVLRLKL
jgi:serine protease Do